MAAPISLRKALHEWKLYLFILPTLLLVGVFCIYFPRCERHLP